MIVEHNLLNPIEREMEDRKSEEMEKERERNRGRKRDLPHVLALLYYKCLSLGLLLLLSFDLQESINDNLSL